MVAPDNDTARARVPPFQACAAMLQDFLQQRDAIVARIDTLLNCQKMPLDYQQDAARLSRLFKACFHSLPGRAHEHAALCEQLEQARCDMGFRPRASAGNDIIDPAQMLLRALHLWRQTRWPGQKGRLRYAHTLYNLYLLRCLMLCLLRLWDEPAAGVPARLGQLQQLLDAVWQRSPADQPRLVRNVCWLLPVALSPTTDALGGYFDVAARVADSFSAADRCETQRAWVQTGAGHLCAQLRHLSVQRGVTPDDHELVLLTRRSNALDVALLVEGLVTLMEAYAQSLQQDDSAQRQQLALAICHGFAPDPELFVQRLDLLGPYSMIEMLFISTSDDGRCDYTPAGRRHLALLQRYAGLLPSLLQPLLDDLQRSRHAAHDYLPQGALFGFSSNLLELMAFKTLQLDSELRYGLEDVFTPGDASKREWVNSWRRLPHVKPEVAQQYEYPQDFVDAMLTRVQRVLQQRLAAEWTAPTAGRLQLLSQGAAWPSALQQVQDLARPFVLASDAAEVATGRAAAMDAGDLQHCRMEGEFLVSYATTAGWVAIGKDLLTDVLGAGHDARLAGLPPAAANTLCLMCPALVVLNS